MKKLTTLLFSILISFNSYGEWTEVTKTSLGEFDVKFYIDKDTIRKNGRPSDAQDFQSDIKKAYRIG